MEDFPTPITKQATQTILNQMNNAFYQFTDTSKKIGFGFFSHIKNQDKNIPIIIINGYLIDVEYNDKINILINNSVKTLELGDTRYINEELNISIIEIKQNENNNFYFLDIDDILFENDYENNYYKKSNYILQINDVDNIFVSYGLLKGMNKTEFIYSGNINKNSKFSLIFNLSNHKLIGIDKKCSKYYNKGIFFKNLIEEFMDMYSNKSFINEISILIDVSKKDTNKKIYFLNTDYYELLEKEIKSQETNQVPNCGIKNMRMPNQILNLYLMTQSFKNCKLSQDYSKRLNEFNTKLFINNKSYKYSKYFIPEKEGEYKINLKFNVNLTICSHMFEGCKNIKEIDFISFNTKYIRDMSYMFSKCHNLKKINLFSFNTKNVRNMSYMFSECTNLISLDLSSFDWNNVTDASNIFFECNNLMSLDLSSFNAKNLTNKVDTFTGCNKLDKKYKIRGLINSNPIYITFRWNGLHDLHPPLKIECTLEEQISDLIERYYSISKIPFKERKYIKFIFNAKALRGDLTLEEAGLTNNANIFVMSTKGVRG